MMNPHISIKDAAITVTDYDNRHKIMITFISLNWSL